MTLDTVPGFISIGVDDGPRAPSFGKSYKEQKESQGYNFARENDLYDESDSILHKEITIGEEHHHSNEIQISRSMDQYDRRTDNNGHSNRRHSGDNRPSQHSEPRRISIPPRNIDRPSTGRAHTPPPRRRQQRRTSMGSQHYSHGDLGNRHHRAEYNDNHNAEWNGEQQQRGHDPRRQAKSSPPRQRRRSSMGHSTKYYPPAEYNEHQHHHGNNHNAEWNVEQQHDNNNAPPRRRQQRRRSNESQKYNPRAEPMPRPSSVDHHLERQHQSNDRIKRPSRMKSMEQPRRPDARRSSPQRRRNTMGATAATTNREASTSSPSVPDSNNKQGLLTGMKYAVDPMERLNPMARKLMEARKLRKARQNFG